MNETEVSEAGVEEAGGLKQRIVGWQYGFAVALVVANVCIAITGSVVRVTGSGLGCSEWPNCLPGSMVPVQHPELSMLHQWIEYGNRLLSVVVGIIGVLCFLAAWWSRPHRKRVLWLSASMLSGIFVQGVIGGITVQNGLLWWTVAVHMVVSPVLAWFAVMLLRSLRESDAPPRPRTHPWVPRLLAVQAVVLVGLLVAGTMVTGAGPHAGDEDVARLDLPVATLVHVHAAFLYVFLALVLAVGFLLWRGPAPRDVRTRYFVQLGVVLAQGAIGFIQYFGGVPGVLVVVHVFGAMLVTVATASLWAWSRERPVTEEAGQHEPFATASL